MSDQKDIPVTEADLADFDESYESSPVDEGEFDTIPDGKYQACVHRAELVRTSKGEPMLKWTLRVLGPTHAGRQLFRYNVLTNDNMPRVKKDLYVCGLRLARLSELPAHLERLLDVTLEVTKKTKGDFEAVYLNKRIKTAGEAEAPPAAPAATPKSGGKPAGKAKEALSKF